MAPPSCEITCIIPARDPGPALRETAAHLRRWGPPERIEILVIDDGSATPVEEELASDLGVDIHRCATRQGVSRARNFGAALAQGNILLFLDAHVCFSHNYLNDLRMSGVADHQGLFGCATRLMDDYGQFRDLARELGPQRVEACDEYYGWQLTLDPLPNVAVNRICLSHTPFAVPYVGACALAVSRALFRKLGGFDDGLSGFGSLEDAELAARCWSFGKSVYMLPTAVCHHWSEPHFNSVSTASSCRDPRDNVKYDGSFLNALRMMYLHFPEALFADIVRRINQDLQRRQLPLVDGQFPCAELRVRRDVLDFQRTQTKEWVFNRMTHV